jgi:hypothetical protein
MNNITNETKREKWKKIIEDQEKSSLSQEAFCKANNLPYTSFIYYRGIFRRKQQPNKSSGAFAPITVAKAVSVNEICLTLPNGFQCTFPTDLESSRIKELVGIFLSC